jgi:hypothetical protein
MTRPGRALITKDAVGEEHRLAQVVGHEDRGEALLRVQVADHLPQLLAGEGVERPEGLVQHQELRLVDQRAAQARALLHAARELPGILAPLPRQPDRGQQRLGLARYSAVPAQAAERCGSTTSSGSSTLSSVSRQGSITGFWNAIPAID